MQARRSKLTGAIEGSGLKREQIAAEAAVTVSHLRNLEAGRNRPSLGLARRLAAALDVTVDDIFPESRERTA